MTVSTADSRRMASPGASAILAWTLAWGLTGVALYVSGVFNSPRTGPLWLALAGGATPWAFAGAHSFRSAEHESSNRLNPAVLVIWALAYLAAFGLAAFAAAELALVLGGFLLMLAGWSIGAGMGAFASTWILMGRSRLMRSIGVEAFWFVGFLAGGYVGLMGLYLGPELGKIAIGSLVGQPAALALGSGVGCAVGGLIASAIAVPLTRWVTR